LKGVLKAMLISKLKITASMMLVCALVVGIGGLSYPSASAQDKPGVAKPRSELEALRHENELLKLNLTVVLEKVRAQEEELRALKKQGGEATKTSALLYRIQLAEAYLKQSQKRQELDTVKAAEDALKALRDASNAEARMRAADALERAAKKLREHSK
jgi:hypothetical protein